MTIAQAAALVLERHGKPMHVREILKEIVSQRLVEMAAVDKQHVLYWTLLSRSLGGPTTRSVNSRPFYKHGAATFGLAHWLNEEQRRVYEQARAQTPTEGSSDEDVSNELFWRDELFGFLERSTAETELKPVIRLQWRGRPEYSFELVVLDGEPRARVTDELIEKLDRVDESMLEPLRPSERDRFNVSAKKIRAARGKTISLNQACNIFIPQVSQERQTLTVNAFEALRIELEGVRRLNLTPEQRKQIESLGPVASFHNLAQALGMVDDEEEEEEIVDGSSPEKEPEPEGPDEKIALYERHHNLIFFGPPGTGKSHAVADIVKKHLGADERSEVFRVTFHPEYSYFDFIGTYRPATKWLGIDRTMRDVPSADGRAEPRVFYTFVPGPFSLALVTAARNPERNIVLLIEEINRGNCAAVFGDVFQLLDRVNDEQKDEFGLSQYAITPTSEWAHWIDDQSLGTTLVWSNGKLRLPSNLYLYATMNTSDQSLFQMDTAFRRRWGMQYQGITSKVKPTTRVPLHADDKEGVLWTDLMSPLNRAIVEHKRTDDKQMGAYFVRPTTGEMVDPLEFSSKVLFYLWADVFRDEPGLVFIDAIRTFDMLYHRYESGKDVFRPEIIEEVRRPAKGEHT